jgi:hypothetical protein
MVTLEEKKYLRELAKRQSELACSDEMERLRKQHWNLNTRNSGSRPVVRIETEPLAEEIIPKDVRKCETPFAKRMEDQMLYKIYHHEVVGDDQLIPNTYQMGWRIHVDYFGFPVTKKMATNSNGIVLSFKVNHAIESIKEDFYKLKPLTVTVDREYTESYRSAVMDAIGDILPIEMTGWPALATFLTRNLLDLMSMENLYFSLIDEPDEVHRLMEYLLNNAIRLMKFFENERIMYVNNGEVDLWTSTYPFTDKLPAPDFKGVPRLKDMFLRTDSQETIGVSPAMFNEFFLPYYQKLCALGGLWYYGCCEPVHPIWESSLSKIPNIKKLSICKWCNEEIMGHHLRNSGIVYSRKIDATFMGVDSGMDEDGLARYIRATMEKAKDCQIEFIARDIITTFGNPQKLHTAVKIMRQEIANALGG